MRLTAKRVLTEAWRLLNAGKADLDAAAAHEAEAERLRARAKRRLSVAERVAREHYGEPVRH